MLTVFVDTNADLETIDFIGKSLNEELYDLLIKGTPLDKTKLVQVEKMLSRNGKTYKKLVVQYFQISDCLNCTKCLKR